jgi:hypothetical protein
VSRELNPRRVIYRQLMDAKRWLGAQTSVFSEPPSLRWFADEPGGEMRYHREKRRREDVRDDEYAERNPETLTLLIQYCQAVIVRMEEVIEYAEARLAEQKVES